MKDFFLSLGLDGTVLVLFVMSGIMFVVLTEFLYKPFAEALEKREQATAGTADEAQEILNETQKVRAQYELTAKKLAAEIKSIFDTARTQAQAETKTIIDGAKSESEKLIEGTRLAIVTQTAEAQAALQKEAPQVVTAIVQQMIGRERV